jgi:hypothetical protein
LDCDDSNFGDAQPLDACFKEFTSFKENKDSVLVLLALLVQYKQETTTLGRNK